MNTLDVFIIIVAFAAAARGVATGFLRQMGSIGGFLIGLLVGAVIAAWFASYLPLSPNRSVGVVLLFFSIAFLASGIGEAVGSKAAGLMQRYGLGPIDGALGAVFGFFGAIFATWLLAASFGSVGGPTLTYDIQTSRILTALDRTLPPAPDVTAKLGRVIGASRFPRVFAGLEPTPAPPVTGPNAAAVNAAVAAAQGSTLRIVGAGCGGISEGSGFYIGDGLVVTNAHVIAGIDRPIVQDRRGDHRATIVDFNPDMDIAVLRTTGITAPALTLDQNDEPRGTIAAVLGYPGGGGFTAGPAAILERQTAVGRNIYDAGLIRRDIYVLQAIVRPGNSGGPLVSPDGKVVGVVFATSTTNSNIGYALTSTEVTPDIARAKTSGSVDSGACLAE